MARVYVAGPMSGFPDFNRPAFNAAAAVLRARGHHVENPAEIPHQDGAGWEHYMRLALLRMLTCDAVVFLAGWAGSRGARIEHGLAHELRVPMAFQLASSDPIPSLSLITP